MKELAGRLTALDPDAGAAVRVIAYFDRLSESRAGLEALVRGAAVLAGVPALLVDAERRVRVRVEADGTRRDAGAPPDPGWPSAALVPGGAAALWLERAEAAPSVVDAVILERAAGAVRLVLDRTRGRAAVEDPALVETVLDAGAPEAARLHAARGLGLDPSGTARALAPLDGPPMVVAGRADAGLPNGRNSNGLSAGRAGAGSPAGRSNAGPPNGRNKGGLPTGRSSGGLPTGQAHAVSSAGRNNAGPLTTQADAGRPTGRTDAGLPSGRTDADPLTARALPGLPDGRVGVGPEVPVLELPRSWAEARTALRFTAEGTALDPGPKVVHADELGGVALLAGLVAPGAEAPPDVQALEAAGASTPWLLATLHAVVSTASLRAAAAEINVHHSTLQDRLSHAEHLLGWPLRTPQGRLRLQLALAMRHLARS
ncbi:helix-turn-helix domain-containing protein [Streptomyces griseorubiginosus]|uniref:PucR family transcriptional regulator n=1 Tax=Streptomyces griseorubiginosus TaxID=67304 RepID=UPI002E7FEFE3|nr:helix-turn-helix domain-containing protein [Streptomyces griseorubiginosus]WUB42449.1 helix-turn-helix domain-containing protein [Streptomyces griseorubiginosus]WUB50967.1 helix-turn-helix domain-containing protein [Streptomyces griseorubiginosus]